MFDLSLIYLYQGLSVTLDLFTVYQGILTILFFGTGIAMVLYLRLNFKMLNKLTRETTENKEVLQTVFKSSIRRDALQSLVRLLATSGRFNSYEERQLLIDFLPATLISRLKRSDIANVDIQNMVSGINAMNGDNMKAFLENVRNQLSGSQAVTELEAIIDKIARSS